jgi:DNA-binding LacI/PurR family transcriptional regulator
MISIYDLAREAGVSAATVSRALNHPELVSDATRERVLSSAQKLGYWARGRKNARRTSGVTVIGAVGPFSTSSAAQLQLNGILERARDLPVEVVAHDHEQVRLTAKAVANLPIAGRVDGLIVTNLAATPSAIVALRGHEVPAVLLGTDNAEVPSVTTDHRAGTLAVVDLLAELRAASLLIVGIDVDSDSGRHFLAPERPRSHDAVRRFKSVFIELRRRGVAVRPDGIVYGTENISETTRIIATTLVGRALPVAIFAATDELATAAVRAAAQLGLVIPRDVHVIGYGDSSVAEALSLTSVREPLVDAGRLALEQVVALTYGETVPMRSRLDPVVVVRSTTPPAAEPPAPEPPAAEAPEIEPPAEEPPASES